MSGLHTLGQRCAPTVRARTTTLGWVFADYSWGQTQFKELQSYYESLGKPQQFQAAFKALSDAYDDASTSWAIRALFISDKMKTVGEQSVMLRKQHEGWAQTQGKGGPPPSAVPDVPPPPSGASSLLPWWGWALVAAAGVGLVAVAVVPSIASAVAAGRTAKRLA